MLDALLFLSYGEAYAGSARCAVERREKHGVGYFAVDGREFVLVRGKEAHCSCGQRERGCAHLPALLLHLRAHSLATEDEAEEILLKTLRWPQQKSE